ncbi:MAG TPA: hypothetical protein VFY29_11535 [Terriglobia bacterium]|nr:hypothetical protein [Terriglobia bacterium]
MPDLAPWQWLVGVFSAKSLLFDAILAPGVVCGGLAGLWLIRRIPQRVFDILIVGLTAGSVTLLLLTS